MPTPTNELAAAEIKNLLSPTATRKIEQIIKPVIGKIAKVVVDDLDAADGKSDGMVQKAIIVQRFDKLFTALSSNREEAQALLREVTPVLRQVPETVPAKTVLGAVETAMRRAVPSLGQSSTTRVAELNPPITADEGGDQLRRIPELKPPGVNVKRAL